MIEEEKIVKIRGGGMTIYRPVFQIGSMSILEAPSKPGNLLLFGKEVPNSKKIAGTINQISNAVEDLKHRRRNH